MGKYIGSVCRLCRREGEKLFLKGARCYTHRCAVDRRQYAPGQHGATAKRGKMSNYGIQMREKQKVKRVYGLFEKQFRLYFKRATKATGVTGFVLLQSLERRIDNVIYQLGFATSRRQARQLVGHGFVHINGKRVNVSSCLVNQNDEIALQLIKKGQQLVKDNIKANEGRTAPAWLQADYPQYKAKVTRLPERADIAFPVKEQLIVELYSR